MENHHLVREFSHSTWWIFPVRYAAVYQRVSQSWAVCCSNPTLLVGIQKCIPRKIIKRWLTTSIDPNSIYPLVIYHNYGNSPFLMGKSTINGHFQ
jgi:hypothetical protein